MIIVDKETFEAEVQQSSMPCVVDLWGPQCGPCLALMPEVEKLAEAYEGKLKFCKLNVAENRRLVISLRVMAVPTILFYKGGECVARISGDAVSIEPQGRSGQTRLTYADNGPSWSVVYSPNHNSRSDVMGKLSGKKLLLLGERDGVPGPAMADVFANSGAEVLFSATECFV